jgi:hypothetical protein
VWSSLTTLPSWARIAVWLPGFGLTLLACGWFYRRLWRGERLSGTGMFAPPDLGAATDIALSTVVVWFLLTAPFAFGTYLSDRDRLLAQLEPKEQTRDAFYKATDQYAWHAVDVVPFINATETLNWTEPARHWKERRRGEATPQTSSAGYSTATGVLLVIYKISCSRPCWRPPGSLGSRRGLAATIRTKSRRASSPTLTQVSWRSVRVPGARRREAGLAIERLAVWEAPLIVDDSRPPIPADYPEAVALPNAQHRTLDGQTHAVAPEVLAPVLAEFFAT